jgi:hypothetical protein
VSTDIKHLGRIPRLILATGVGVAALAVGAWLLLGTDGDTLEHAEPVQALPAAATDDDTALEGEELALEALPVTYEVFLDRDPFEPVLQEAGTGGGDAAEQPDESQPVAPAIGAGLPAGSIVIDPTTGQATVVQTTTNVDAPSSTEPTDVSAPSNPSTSDGCRGEDEVVCDGRVVTLVGVTTDDSQAVATVQVDSTVYTVAQGEVFATSFRLLLIDGSCVTLQYGDDTVRLCEGQRVLK